MLLRRPAISNLPLSLLLDSLSIVHLFPLKSTSIFIFLVKFRNSLGNCYIQRLIRFSSSISIVEGRRRVEDSRVLTQACWWYNSKKVAIINCSTRGVLLKNLKSRDRHVDGKDLEWQLASTSSVANVGDKILGYGP
jgi:hypothetical protein